MLGSCGVECHIEVNNQTCTEFDITKSSEAIHATEQLAQEVVTKYVQIEANQTFKIKYSLSHDFDFMPGDAITVDVNIDGRDMVSRLRNAVCRRSHTFSIGSVRYLDGGIYCKRAFETKKLQITPSGLNLQAQSEQLGRIIVTTDRVYAEHPRVLTKRKTVAALACIEALTDDSIGQRDLRISAGASRLEQPTHSHPVCYSTRAEARPVVAFVFLYRTSGILHVHRWLMQDALRNIGVLNSMHTTNVEDLTMQELQALVRVQKRKLQDYEERDSLPDSMTLVLGSGDDHADSDAQICNH